MQRIQTLKSSPAWRLLYRGALRGGCSTTTSLPGIGGPASILGSGRNDTRTLSSGNRGGTALESIRYQAARFREWLKPFVSGSKQLWSDYLKLRALTQEEKHGKRTADEMSWEERRLLRRTMEQVLLAFPLVAFWIIIPFLGNLAPFLGLAMPKLLLPPQFWTIDQKRMFARQHFLELHDNIQPTTLQLLRNVGIDVRGTSYGTGSNNLLTLSPVFSNGGAASLRVLCKQHLVHLASAFPGVVWYKKALGSIFPRAYIVSVLEREAKQLMADDRDIEKLGLDTLSPDQIVNACYERGLAVPIRNKEDVDTKAAQEKLKLWLEVSCNKNICSNTKDIDSIYAKEEDGYVHVNHEKEGESSTSEEKSEVHASSVPTSLLLHAPALLLQSDLESEKKKQQ